MVVSKEVKRLREYEQALLRAYQALLKALLEVGRSGAARGGAWRGRAGPAHLMAAGSGVLIGWLIAGVLGCTFGAKHAWLA